VSREQVAVVYETHRQNSDHIQIRTINWYIPDIDMPFFGGLNTAFRLADKLRREHGVINRFVVLSEPNERYVRSALAAAFAGLADSEIVFYNGQASQVEAIPPADAAVATLWLTAVHVARAPGVMRRFYLMQDFEPGFYPASTMFAMAEETYKLGLYGICNTKSMHDVYTEEYGGKATYFVPAVDGSIYNTLDRRTKSSDEPVTIFAYARDHFRNCWELVYAALAEIKSRHGDSVRIVAGGARYLPPTADFIDMRLRDYRATGAIYRETDIGLTMQISRHPSYLPLELMASGVAMVAADSTWFRWLFEDGRNADLTMRTLDDVVARLESLILDTERRKSIAAAGTATIDARHSDWDEALSGVYDYMCDPEGITAPTA
jgi:glycosyltransferase involved in cell wall biosynthesis